MAKPNLFIVGAPKCGTTAWLRYLDSHPEIFVSEVKETSFFADDLPGMQWLDSREDYEKLFDRGAKCKVIGDASAAHLFSSTAARGIAEYNPTAKILVFLRDQQDFLPALHNHYLTRFEEGIEDFQTAWRISDKRPSDSLPETCTEPRLLDYPAQGRFYEQLKRYRDHFPPEQIRVFQLQDWSSDPRGAYLEILDFLGIEDDGRIDFPRVNEAKYFRKKWIGKLIMKPPRVALMAAAILRKIFRRNALHLNDRLSEIFATKGYQTRVSPEMKAEISSYYAEDNRRLAKLLSEIRQAHPSSSAAA